MVDKYPVLLREESHSMVVALSSNQSGRRTIIRNQQVSMSSSDTSIAAIKQQVFTKHKKATRKKSGPKATTLATYSGVFLLVIALVAIGYQPPQKVENGIANAVQSAPAVVFDSSQAPSVDQLVATSVAGQLAERANLPIASNVAELSVSLSVKSELAQTDSTTISKPQIVQPSAGSRTVVAYTTQAGDTAQAVAAAHGISDVTLKWANSLTSDALDAGKTLTIPPVDGVVYTVKDGDSVESLAQKYSVSQDRIVAYNDLELNGISKDMKIILPGATLPETERPGYVAPRPAYAAYGAIQGGTMGSSSRNNLTASVGNKYAPGYCTWYVYERRAAAGRPIGSFWGNATSWKSSAISAGFVVNNTPAPGAILQNHGGYGHVAYVESVGEDGSVTVREMNYAGYNVISSRTLSAAQAANYNFIH